MFYNYIIESTDTKTLLYTSIKPIHHVYLYYKELRKLNEEDVITLSKPCTRNLSDKGWVFMPAVWRIKDMARLKTLASCESSFTEAPYCKGKLISILNAYNNLPWQTPLTRLYFNKKRCNGYVAWGTTEHEEHFNVKKSRAAFNDEFFGKDNWTHYDVPSSIPQVFYLFNNGKWLGERVWDKVDMPKLHGQRTMFCKTERSLALSLYQDFQKRVYNKGNKYWKTNQTKWWGEWQGDTWVESGDKAMDVCTSMAKQYRHELFSVIGPVENLREQVFIHESNIYLLVLDKFMKQDCRVYEVYDSFYWEKGRGVTQDMVEKWVQECAEYYYNNLKKLEDNERIFFNVDSITPRLKKERAKRSEAERRAKRRDIERRSNKPSKKNKPSVKNKIWKRKVRLWLQRHNNEFNPKWNDQEREYAVKHLNNN